MTVPNAALAYVVLDHIDADPESWDQRWWFKRKPCGTTGCFAGQVLTASGYRMSDGVDIVMGSTDFVSLAIAPDGSEVLVPVEAQRLLGIDGDAGDALFYASNSRADLGRLVAEIFGPRPEPAS